MNATRPVVMLLCAGILAGCGRPRLARWDACLQSGTAIIQVGQPPAWSVARGSDDVLTVDALWGYPPVVTHRARSGVLQVQLPAGPRSGQIVSLAPGDGNYTETDGRRVYESSALVGTIEFLAVASDRAELRLDVRATRPSVDVESMGDVSFVGEIEAERLPFAECFAAGRR